MKPVDDDLGDEEVDDISSAPGSSAPMAETAEVTQFLADLRALGRGAAPEPSADLVALLGGAVPLAPRRRMRVVSRVALFAAAAVVATVLAAAGHTLPAPAQRFVSTVVNHLTPFHINPKHVQAPVTDRPTHAPSSPHPSPSTEDSGSGSGSGSDSGSSDDTGSRAPGVGADSSSGDGARSASGGRSAGGEDSGGPSSSASDGHGGNGGGDPSGDQESPTPTGAHPSSSTGEGGDGSGDTGRQHSTPQPGPSTSHGGDNGGSDTGGSDTSGSGVGSGGSGGGD